MPRAKKKLCTANKLFSLYPKHVRVIKSKLNEFGDASGFIQFCLDDEELVSRYLESKEK